MQSLIKELNQYMEKMDEYQLRVTLGFIKKILGL